MGYRSSRSLRFAVPLALALAACGGGSPPPGRVYAIDRPPPPRVEIAGATPGVGWVWIPGHYRSDRAGYIWDTGHWDRVPRGRRRWQPGHWAHSRQGWYWTEGRWR